MPSPALHTLFRKESFSPSERRPGGLFAPAGRPKPLPLGEVALRSNDGEGKPVSQEPPCSDKLSLCQSDTIAAPALLRQRPCPLRRFAPRSGCGTQRLLRCRLHPAGRCPNSSSLFPPLAAVVAVAPKGRAFSPARYGSTAVEQVAKFL